MNAGAAFGSPLAVKDRRSRRGSAWHGQARLGGPGEARQGWAGRGEARQGGQDKVCRGKVRRG